MTPNQKTGLWVLIALLVLVIWLLARKAGKNTHNLWKAGYYFGNAGSSQFEHWLVAYDAIRSITVWLLTKKQQQEYVELQIKIRKGLETHWK